MIALIQDARRVAGREETPIYGVSSDGGDWEFVRMDARGNVGYPPPYGRNILDPTG
jgi:hypothetical protein